MTCNLKLKGHLCTESISKMLPFRLTTLVNSQIFPVNCENGSRIPLLSSVLNGVPVRCRSHTAPLINLDSFCSCGNQRP